jgi:DNA-binding transcriptional regulator GbsR (MarR family)
MQLTPITQKYILHWGEMGARWGINRTVAQIHALLYLSPQPLHAEEIAETLSVARSNVSYGLRELQGWGIVHVTHILGDRRDHFESMKDVWEMFRIIVDERRRREVDPTLEMLRTCVTELEQAGPKEAYSRERLSEMLRFFEEMVGLHQEMSRLPGGTIRRLAGLRGKLRKLLGGGKEGGKDSGREK